MWKIYVLFYSIYVFLNGEVKLLQISLTRLNRFREQALYVVTAVVMGIHADYSTCDKLQQEHSISALARLCCHQIWNTNTLKQWKESRPLRCLVYLQNLGLGRGAIIQMTYNDDSTASGKLPDITSKIRPLVSLQLDAIFGLFYLLLIIFHRWRVYLERRHRPHYCCRSGEIHRAVRL